VTRLGQLELAVARDPRRATAWDELAAAYELLGDPTAGECRAAAHRWQPTPERLAALLRLEPLAAEILDETMPAGQRYVRLRAAEAQRPALAAALWPVLLAATGDAEEAARWAERRALAAPDDFSDLPSGLRRGLARLAAPSRPPLPPARTFAELLTQRRDQARALRSEVWAAGWAHLAGRAVAEARRRTESEWRDALAAAEAELAAAQADVAELASGRGGGAAAQAVFGAGAALWRCD
jgi:hypothetical protein